MFRKRNLNISDSAVLRPKETVADDEDDESSKDAEQAPLVKRTRPSGMVKEAEASVESDLVVLKPELEEVFDGSELEEQLEAKRRAAAVVNVDEQTVQQPRKASKYGPTSAPVYMRATTIVDYKPDLCKDYNQTGFCGFGDACIYLHDRTTYVSGNILDQRWDEMLKKKSQAESEKKVEVASSDTTCNICNTPLRPPIVRTRCGHKFCRNCAMDRFEKVPTCATCGGKTLGIFNEVKT